MCRAFETGWLRIGVKPEENTYTKLAGLKCRLPEVVTEIVVSGDLPNLAESL